MLAKHLAMVLVGTALASAPTLAQTQPQGAPAGTPPPATQQPTTAAPAGGAGGNFMTQIQPNQWRASNLEGLDVYNNNNEKIGDVSELIVDNTGRIQAVVIGVGGFLGLGERNVAIPFDQVRFVNEPRAAATAGTGTGTGAAGTAGTAGTTGATTGTTAGAGGTTGAAPTTTGSTAQGDAAGGTRQTPDHAMVNMTREQLQAAPEFRTNR